MADDLRAVETPTFNHHNNNGPHNGSSHGFIPSFADAAAMVSAPYSCLVLETHRRHVGLAPVYMRRKRTGIQEELDAELLKYSESLKGVPLAYDHIGILGPQGDICDDNGYIHMDISASFVVFNPQPGQKLRGIVNKLGVSHVGCLVHGCFNASVPKPNRIPVDTWREVGPRIGAELEFEVSQIDADQVGVVLIRGRLERTKVQEMLAMAECAAEATVPEDQPLPLSQLPDTPPEPGPEETPTKKKKKKKQQKTRDKQQAVEAEPNGLAAGDGGLEEFSDATVKQEREEEEEAAAAAWTDAQADCQPDGTPGSEKKKKKKKKKTRDQETETWPKEERDEVVVTATPEQHCSDSSGYLSDKPSRKRRLEAEPQLCSTAEPQTPPKSKKKKKRKSEVQEFA